MLTDLCLGRTGQPTKVAFDSDTTGKVNTLPDLAYTLRLVFRPPSIAWTFGQAFGASTLTGTGITAVTFASGISSGIPWSASGSIYSGNPIVSFSGGGGTGAAAVATASGGAITKYPLYQHRQRLHQLLPAVLVNGVDISSGHGQHAR